MIRADLNLCLEIEGPLLTRSTSPGEFGVDAVVARNHEGIPFIPGSHIAGKVRQALEEITGLKGAAAAGFNSEFVQRITGREAEDFLPCPKSIFISDLLLMNCVDTVETRSRIQIDQRRGSVKKGALLIMESLFAPGLKFYFVGVISIFTENEEELADYERYLETAVKWTTQAGGYRSIGFGRLRQAGLKRKKISTYEPEDNWPGPGCTVDVLIRPDHPFCIAGKRIDGNLFESRESIPGGAFIGAIVNTWKYLSGSRAAGTVEAIEDPDRNELKKAFNSISMRHAFPSDRTLSRPVTPPLSLVKVATEGCLSYYDVALCKKPCLIHDKPPAFSVDWKDRSDVLEDFGWPVLQRDMRVRTAIDTRYLRSREAELFAYETVVPDDHVWISSITIPQGHADSAGRRLSGLLKHGITGLGKTMTTASITIMPGGTARPCLSSRTSMRDGLWIITLQTPALLTDPEKLTGKRGREALKSAYKETWSQISNNTLGLRRFFAKQRLEGGAWPYSRFQKGKDGAGRDKPYYPWLLTTEGSVFVLEPIDKQEKAAAECINIWFENGLPLPDWAKERYKITKNNHEVNGDHWSACPYICQNGYGEIAVNLDVHWLNYPGDEIRRDIDQHFEEKKK